MDKGCIDAYSVEHATMFVYGQGVSYAPFNFHHAAPCSWLNSLDGILSQLHTAAQSPKYKFLKEALEVTEVLHYDYVIVGGETTGYQFAATLSQNFNVLLLERGGVPYGNNNISRIENFVKTLADVFPNLASQRFVLEDGVINARARVLGGGSCLNAGLYIRANPEYVRKVEWDGKDAPLNVGILPDNGFTYDHMYGTKVGGTIFDDDGNQHTAVDLLELKFIDNPMNAIFVPSPNPIEISLIQVVGITKFRSYIEAASGSNFARVPLLGDFGMIT
eukprot:Gb_11029 [translate_table: standard]